MKQPSFQKAEQTQNMSSRMLTSIHESALSCLRCSVSHTKAPYAYVQVSTAATFPCLCYGHLPSDIRIWGICDYIHKPWICPRELCACTVFHAESLPCCEAQPSQQLSRL